MQEDNETHLGPLTHSQILPTHCLNVFIPLVDVEGEANGGTEFCLGSHFHTVKEGTDIVWQDAAWKSKLQFSGETRLLRADAGQILAFDYRTLHRALAHQGTKPRPLLYFTFTKPWFRDSLNFACAQSLREAEVSLREAEVGVENVVVSGRGESAAAPAEAAVDSPNDPTFQHRLDAFRRRHFPAFGAAPEFFADKALKADSTGSKSRVFADGAAGTQVPQVVGDAMLRHLFYCNANVGGEYPTSEAALRQVSEARRTAAHLLGCKSKSQIAFGQNCTNLLFHLSRALEISCFLEPENNVVVSQACHDANVAPWLLAAKKAGCEVRWIPVRGGADDAVADR